MTRQGLAALAGLAALGLAGLALARPDLSPSAMRAHPPPPGSSSVKSWPAEMGDSFRHHRPSPAELSSAMAAAHAGAAERRQMHLVEMRQRFAALGVSNREAFEEFRVHARRMAYLNRAKVVATTELEEPKRAKAIARIDKLTELEQARHARRVEALKAQAAGAASGGPPGMASGGPPPMMAPGMMPPPAPSGSAFGFKHHGPGMPPGMGHGPAPKGSAR